MERRARRARGRHEEREKERERKNLIQPAGLCLVADMEIMILENKVSRRCWVVMVVVMMVATVGDCAYTAGQPVKEI